MSTTSRALTKIQLEVLVDNIPPSLGAVFFGIVAIFVVFYEVVDISLLLGWTVAACLVASFRFIVFLWIKDKINNSFNFRFAEKLIVFSATLTGIIWGIASIIFSVPTDMFYWVFLAFFMGGYASGAVFSTSALLPACAGYFFPTILPIMVWFFFQDDTRAPLMGMLLLVFTIAAWKMARNAHDFLIDKVEAQIQYQLIEQDIKAKDAKVLALQTMAGGVAHDLNNILASISGNVYLAKGHSKTPDMLQKQLDRIEEGANKAMLLGRKMLDFSDADICSSEELNIDHLLKKVVSEFTQEEGKSICLSVEGDLPTFSGNAEQFESMMSALISNAFESYEHELGNILVSAVQLNKLDEVSVDWEALGTHACIAIYVQDDGCGIAKKFADKIFDPFFTTKFTGRGLGLSTVYGIVQRIGGKVKIVSNIEEGTTVSVYLPV